MKNKIVLTVMSVVLLSSAAMAQGAYNNDGHRMGNHNSDRGYQNTLNLTDEQYNKMQELRNAMRAERDTAREAQRLEMEKFYNAPNFDANEAKKLADKHRTDRDVRRMKNYHAMNQILTAEQRSQYRDMRGNHMKRGNHMNGGYGNHMNNGGHRNNNRMHNNNW